MSKFNLTIICVLFASVCVGCYAGKVEKWVENMKSFSNFSCRKPQLRAIRAEKLLGDKMLHHEIAIPHSAILHRCGDDTGCCADNDSSCVAKNSKDVEVYFRLYNRVSGTHRFEKYEGKSDTECVCRKLEDFIK